MKYFIGVNVSKLSSHDYRVDTVRFFDLKTKKYEDLLPDVSLLNGNKYMYDYEHINGIKLILSNNNIMTFIGVNSIMERCEMFPIINTYGDFLLETYTELRKEHQLVLFSSPFEMEYSSFAFELWYDVLKDMVFYTVCTEYGDSLDFRGDSEYLLTHSGGLVLDKNLRPVESNHYKEKAEDRFGFSAMSYINVPLFHRFKSEKDGILELSKEFFLIDYTDTSKLSGLNGKKYIALFENALKGVESLCIPDSIKEIFISDDLIADDLKYVEIPSLELDCIKNLIETLGIITAVCDVGGCKRRNGVNRTVKALDKVGVKILVRGK